MKLICICFLFLFFSSSFASYGEKKVYVVYFGGHNKNKTTHEIEEMHHSYLLMAKEDKEEARTSLLYSYKHSINGFAAVLTAVEASKLSAMKEVVYVVESQSMKYSLETTKTWEFLGLKELNMDENSNRTQFTDRAGGLLLDADYGKNVIVGVIDSGVWPESRSFDDDGMDPIPESWIEKCKIDPDFDSSFSCNKKIIGAKYYSKNFKLEHGETDLRYDKWSPRDTIGHGTHIASIISGRQVKNVGSLGSFAYGIASGGAPKTQLAIYKVCWRVKKSLLFGFACLLADILAAIDDAISDEVHVMSISIGSNRHSSYDEDLFSISLLEASRKEIVVVTSAGNFGPEFSTTTKTAPWMITVGSSTIDRMFLAPLTLGDKTELKGQTLAPYKLRDMTSLVYAGYVENEDVSEDLSGYCSIGSLDFLSVLKKIVLCECNFLESCTLATEEVIRVGGVGVILVDNDYIGADLKLYSYRLPTILLTKNDGITVLKYINSAGINARASIGLALTTENYEPSPSILVRSSRGPSLRDPHVIKPDLIAPGLNILAAWSEAASPVSVVDDHRIAKYNILCGSSIAAPHVAAIVSLLRAKYPDWSSAAIRSAIMTSTSMHNNVGSLITDFDGGHATPFSSGSGHLMPIKAADPGLVYDASFEDYLDYLCNLGFKRIYSLVSSTFSCPENPSPSYNLNYPSLAISNIVDHVKVQRTVTNVGDPKSTYEFEARPPLGFSVESSPNILSFETYGEKKSFTITVTKDDKTRTNQEYMFSYGYYVWKDNSHQVRSPLVIFLE